MKFHGLLFLIVALAWTTTNGFLLNKFHSTSSIEDKSIGGNVGVTTKLATSRIQTSIPDKNAMINAIASTANSKIGSLTTVKKAEVGVIRGAITRKLAKLSALKGKKVAFMKTLLAAKLAPIVKLIGGKHHSPIEKSHHGLNIFRKPSTSLKTFFTGALSAIPSLSSLHKGNVPKEYILIPTHADLGGTAAGVKVYEDWRTPISVERARYPHVLLDALAAAKKHVYAGPETEIVTEPCVEPSSDEDQDYANDDDVLASSLPIFQPEPFVPDHEASAEHTALPAPVFEYQPPEPLETNFPASLPPAPTLAPLNYGPPVQFPPQEPATYYGVPING